MGENEKSCMGSATSFHTVGMNDKCHDVKKDLVTQVNKPEIIYRGIGNPPPQHQLTQIGLARVLKPYAY